MCGVQVTKAPMQVETARLILSAPTPSDAEAIFERYAGDPEVTRYLGWPRHHSVSDTQQFVASSAAEWERWPAGAYLIRTRSDGRLIGGTGLHFEHLDEAVTGYVLAKDAWGQGYATEALGAIVALARRIALRRVYACCHPEHRASWRVLEKCGFTLDPSWTDRAEFPNLAPGELQDVLCYEIVLNRPAAC